MSLRTPIFVLATLLWCLVSVKAAQFETPNRAFHNAYGFRLDGRHQTVACESCHINQQFRGTPTTCYDCHWVRRQDDRYQTRLGTRCEQCHRPTTWSAVQFDHGAVSGTRLNVDHRQLGCAACHGAGAAFRATAVQCVSCHRRDYDATRAPAHAAAGFPVTCEGCHSAGANTWQAAGGGFNHAAVFPLVGLHAQQQCATCHKNNVFRGTPRDCIGCHQADYNRTRNPNHVTAGFSTSCETCHRPSDTQWAGAGFNHAAVFPLVGMHAQQQCAACHRNNVFKGTPSDCIGCHQADYTRTQSPNHAAAGFPTTCTNCHRATDSSWRQGTFNHTRFPLRGPHNVACAQCHTTPGTVAVFSCTVCHDRGRTDAKHREVRAYRYDSAACYSCHPTGRGD